MGDAVVQGVITVVGVTLGVGLTEWAIRLRDRRRRIEEATLDLAMLIPHVIIIMWEGWEGERPDTGIGSEWAARYERISQLVGEVRVKAGWPLRNSAAIRAEAEDLAARLAAAQIDWMQRRRAIRSGEEHEISGAGLYGAVFRGTRTLDDGVSFYEEHGFAAGRPPTG